jgi:hypothetical protein
VRNRLRREGRLLRPVRRHLVVRRVPLRDPRA